MSKRAFVLAALFFGIFGALLAIGRSPPAASAATSPDPNRLQTFAPIDLRGYGKVSGAFRLQGDGSVLEITCEDEKKAQLLQAKYLSDLAELPGVTIEAGRQPTIYAVDGQGSVAAYRADNKVAILAAPSDSALQQLIQQTKPAGVTTAERDVPMYLDRWDKFSFRHYYRPWEPAPSKTLATYDFTADFDYAKREDRAGILLEDAPLATDSAAGMMNSGWASYAVEEAKKRNLPVDIHLNAVAGSEPTWLLNRYREQTQMKMPGFTGNFHDLMSPYLGGQGVLSWSATTGEDALLGVLQPSVRRFAADRNVVSFLEPHGELKHGDQDILLEYGPVADAGYRRFLKGKYGSPGAVAARWGIALKSWDDVRVPELAAFAGWSPDAIDVGGTWRVGYESLTEPAKPAYFYDLGGTPKSVPAPEEWYQAGFDDSGWPAVPGAGNDQQLFLEKRPAIFRRIFSVPAGWTEKHSRVWLYEWDMNEAGNQQVRVVLNGKEIGRSKILSHVPHWSAMEVTGALQDGENTLAIRVPQGYIAYKTYLSPVEPKQYPALGEGLNAQWVDFNDFTSWSRVETTRRGMEMIRQAAPNQPITLMSPDAYADGIKSLATTYGGEFHNTGYMAAFYADYLPSLMRGADLPFSIEPGSPAGNLAEFKRSFGLWQTEGAQSVDYFIQIGDILWKPEIKAYYEARRKQFTLMGQSHFPKAKLAFLSSDRALKLTGYPWGFAPNVDLGDGYWNWNPTSALLHQYPYDGLSQSSFENGEADAYSIIMDCNTSIMDESMVNDIEKWVRAGGVFITLAQTGRHTPEKADSWPISRLTGYSVDRIDRLKPDGAVDETGVLWSAPGERIFNGVMNGVNANGLHLKQVAADAQDLLLWTDGSVAAGMRPLGKGYIVELGAKFTGAKGPDRLEPGDAVRPANQHMRQMLTALLQWRDVRPEPGRLSPYNDFVSLRHAVSNNGLYDVWTLWNRSPSAPQTVSVALDQKAPFFIDIADGRKTELATASLENVTLEAMDTRVFLTPRQRIAQSSADWFDLQRKWWRGATKPPQTTLPKPDHRFSDDLTEGWRFQTLDPAASVAPMLAPDFDDKKWSSRTLGVWDVSDTGGKGRGVFRKTFTVPVNWTGGLVSLWMTSWSGASFVDRGGVWLDGRKVKPLDANGYIAIDLPALAPGSTHQLVVDVQSGGVLAGLRGQCWLSFQPKAADKIDLGGSWSPSADGLTYGSPVVLPGAFHAQFLKRTFSVGADLKGRNVILTVDGSPALVSVLINGRLVRHHHHMVGGRWSLNLTPFVEFGSENEIQLVMWEKPAAGFVKEAFIGVFDPKIYP